MRTVTVAPERLARWIESFTGRHGTTTTTVGPEAAELVAADGAVARIRTPFPSLVGTDLEQLLTHVQRERTVGALLVRRGGVAVGLFEGRRLVSSKIETAYVQGRTKAGGWSQQRYARRRGNQARQLNETAADLLVRLVLPRADELAGVATGGDRASIAEVLADSRLEPLRAITLPRIHPVQNPRLVVLQAFPEQFLAVEIELNELA